jgi:photosystem II stability/assembly factor-like uncharacterized protein
MITLAFPSLRAIVTFAAVIQLAVTCTAQTIDGVEWIAPPAGGNAIRNITFDPGGTGWAVGDLGTILRSTDGGNHWEMCYSGTTDDLRAITFSSPDNGWIVGDNGVFLVTVTGGASWERKDIQTIDQLNDIAFINTNIGILVGDVGLLMQTTDGGVTWVSLKRNDKIAHTQILLNPRGDGFICNADGSMMMVTRFGQVLPTGKEFDSGIADAVCTRKGDRLFILEGKKNIQKTADGRSWSGALLPEVEGPPAGTFLRMAAIDDQRYVVCDVNGSIHVTRDGGRSWTSRLLLASGAVIHALAFRDDSTLIAAGADGIIAKVGLPGCGVQLVNTLTAPRVRKLYYLDEDRALALTDDMKLFNSWDGGRTWSWRAENSSMNAVGIRSIISSNDRIVHVLTDISLFSTTDGGLNWKEHCVVAKICPAVQGKTPSGDIWYGGKGYLVITSAAGGRDRAFLSPRLKDMPLDERVKEMKVEYSLPFDEEVRSFTMVTNRWWIVSTSEGRLFTSKNNGMDWSGYGRYRPNPDFAIPFSEGIVLWLSRDGKARVGNFSEALLTATGAQVMRSLQRFTDTTGVTSDSSGVSVDKRTPIQLVPPVSDVSVTVEGGISIACGKGTCWHSTDQGVHWDRQTLPTDENIAGIQFVDAFDGWAWAKSGKVFRTANGGKSWEISRTTAAAKALSFPNPSQGWMGTSQGYLMRTGDGGRNWSTVVLGSAMGVRDLCADMGGSVWLGLPRGVMKMASGEQRSRFVIPMPEGEELWLMGPMGDSSLVLYTHRGNICVLPAGDSVCRSIPMPVPSGNVTAIGGPDWRSPVVLTLGTLHYRWDSAKRQWISFKISTTTKLSALMFLNARTGCAAGDAGYIVVTHDGGATWTQLPRYTFAGSRGLTYSSLRDVIWASFDDGTVLVSDNECNLWVRLKIPCADAFAGLQFLPPDLLYVYSSKGKIIRIHTSEVLTEEQ